MMNSKLWTGIAALTLALTVAEVAAVSAMARGAQRWWEGEDAVALRRAGSIVGEMVAEQIGLDDQDQPVRVQIADLHSTLAPLAGIAIDTGKRSSCLGRGRTIEIRTRNFEARMRALEARQLVRKQIRDAI